MNAQLIIDTCESTEFNPRVFRDEINISSIINEVRKQYEL